MNHATSHHSAPWLEPAIDVPISTVRPRASALATWSLAVLLTALQAFSPSRVEAVACNPSSITLSSQSEVDNFQANHGPCDEVTGTLIVSGTDITNLDGLAGLLAVYWTEINSNPLLTSIAGLSAATSFNGPFLIQDNSLLANVNGLSGMTTLPIGALFLLNNPSLSDLSGLSNLTDIGASLALMNNDSLVNLDGLSSLMTVASNISILDNAALTNVSGLSGITGFTASLTIRDNPILSSLDGLGGWAELEGLVIDNNDALTDLDALAGLTTIGTGYSSMFIDDNDALVHLGGLSNLVSLDADVEITDNPALESCKALFRLLDPIDHALPGPGPGLAGIPDVNGDVILSGNLPDCNSVGAILAQGIFIDGFESGDTSVWDSTNP